MSDAHHLATSTRFVVVEQLNAAQWEAYCPIGRRRSGGVQNYVAAVADALWMATGRGLGVETIDLDHNRMILSVPEAGTWLRA